MRRGYRYCTTSNPFMNQRYDTLMAIISGVSFIFLVGMFIAWCLCLI